MSKSANNILAILFLLLTLLFIATAAMHQPFFDWVFARHQNIWSWYIRPLFLIPFCYFAYKKSWAGIFITIFGLMTSMFWFSKPMEVSEQALQFLAFEKKWLSSNWDISKVLLALTIPLSFFLLGLAFWKRSLLMGLSVMVLMATGKVVWSVYNASDAGRSILLPAVLGLVLCTTFIALGIKRLNNKRNENT